MYSDCAAGRRQVDRGWRREAEATSQPLEVPEHRDEADGDAAVHVVFRGELLEEALLVLAVRVLRERRKRRAVQTERLAAREARGSFAYEYRVQTSGITVMR